MKAFVATIASLLAAANAQLVGYNNLGAYGLAAPAAAIAPAAYSVAAPAAIAPAAYSVAAPAAIAPAIPAAASSQFHAQDELGQFQFGHASPLSSRQESRNAYGVTTGSYSQVDANGVLQVTNYIADPINGFRVAASNLPIAPDAPVVAPLEAPVFKAAPLEGPVMTLEQVPDTEEVAEAKAKFFEAYEAEKNREKRSVVPAATAPLALPAAFPATYALPHATYANAYATAYSHALPAATYSAALPAIAAPVAAPVAATYAAAPVAATYAAAPVAAPVAATYATAGPAAGAIPSVRTTIKLNPGHSTFYKVDPVA